MAFSVKIAAIIAGQRVKDAIQRVVDAREGEMRRKVGGEKLIDGDNVKLQERTSRDENWARRRFS